MRIRIHNVGPIRDADIDLRGLCVLVGPNGSGKTTLSTVAYSASNASAVAFRSARSALIRSLRLAEMESAAHRVIEIWEDEFRVAFERELTRCVSRDLVKLAREGRAGKGAAPRIYISEPGRDPWTIVFRVDSDGLVVERQNREYDPPTLDLSEGAPTPGAVDARLRRALRITPSANNLYFPAARSGFMQTFSALTALVFGALGGGYFDQATVGTIPGTAADFLRFLAQLRPDQRSRLGHDDARAIERDVLDGAIRLSGQGPTREVTFRPRGFQQSWPVESAATSAAELAPLVLYLRHLAGPRDGVYIDEPEAHFHPASQVELARALLRLASQVRYVVIATHSEFLVSGVSNLLLEQRASHDGKKPNARVSVYDFRTPSKPFQGICVEPLQFDPSEGFDVEQFSRVADDAYARAVQLYTAVHRSPD